jgi:sporulation protein YhbH
MSVFRQHKSSSDRSATDRRRHRDKIEKAIKDGIHDIVSDESIIGKDGKKKIKIPVRGIKEYRFIFSDGPQSKRAASAPGKDVQKGQVVGKKQVEQQGQGNQPGPGGNQPGEEYYEVEITLEDLAKYLFDDLELPELEKKKLRNVTEVKPKRKGHRPQGIRVRLSKRETLKNKIKRQSAMQRSGAYDPEEDERFPFHEKDLKYRHVVNKPKENSSAVVFFLMDVSGSMSTTKRYLARSFFFLVYQFLRHKYENVEIVFISHDTEAREVNEDDFFHKTTWGGTMISSALEMMSDIVEKRYHPSHWNIYGFHCSDGDNWSEDVEPTVMWTRKLIDLCQVYSYCEISPSTETWRNGSSVMYDQYMSLVQKKFRIVSIDDKSDIWTAFKSIFGGKALKND